MVKNKTLLWIAGMVWMIAGVNILRIGLVSYIGHINIVNISFSVVIFFFFWFMIFKRLVVKHTARIKSYGSEKKYFWNFFDMRAFVIMVFMIALGITIRMLKLLPDAVIAFFYSGLGAALAGAGINFIKNYFCYSE